MKVKTEKKCRNCGAEFKLFKTTDTCCSWECYNMLEAEKGKKRETGRREKIKQVSSKQNERLAEYRKLRDEYLKGVKICEVEGCNNNSTNLHHKGGRIGKLLVYVDWFMACCGSCHPNKIHFTQNKWAKEKGYLKTGAEIDKKLKQLDSILNQ